MVILHWNIIRRTEVKSLKSEELFDAIDLEFTSANTPRIFDYAYLLGVIRCYWEELRPALSPIYGCSLYH